MSSSALNGGYNTVNSFSLNAVTIQFVYPWLLLLLLPAVGLMLWPYFRLPKQVRKTRNRVISLVLHSVLLASLVLMISGMSVTATEVNVKNDVILLVDMSDSNKSSEDDMNEFISAVLDSQEPNYRIGIITFANGAVYAAPLRADGNAVFNDYKNSSVPLGNATNIAEALFYARDALSNPANGRIILLSDGVQTDGNALSAVKSVADKGTRVDTVFFSFEGRNREVLISSLDVPSRASLDEVLQISVTTRSASTVAATLKLYDNGEFFADMEVNLTGGEDTFVFEYPLLTPNLHEFCVEIFSEGDTLEENNTYYSYINIEISTNVLIVDGTGNESKALFGLLDETYDVTTVSPEELPRTVSELSRYDQVIFMNVANADLPVGFDSVLTEYVEDYGGGFFTVGGNKAYVQSDMQGSKFENLLPVEASTAKKSLGLLLVIDCSKSMETKVSGNVMRIDLAKEAAIACLDVLGPDDYVGVIGFNTANPADIQLIPMRPIDQKESVANQINNLQTASGTYYSNAINAVVSTITTFDKTELKHVIFLADGTTNESATTIEGQVYPRINQMANRGITTSTIALGPDSVAATTYLVNFAKLGKGEFYSVTDERLLKECMVKETTRVAGEYYNETKFTPIIHNRTSAVAGINELPELGGFFGTKLKEGATMVLAHEGNPIYAEWTRGNGRVGSFTSDLSGNWSSAYFDNNLSGVRFIMNVVAGLFPKVTSNDYDAIRAEFTQDNFTTRVSITTDVATNNLSAQLISPDGSKRALSIEKLSDRSFAGTFHMTQSGLYSIVIDNGTEQFTAYTTFSYSSEYDVFVDETESFAFLESLSRNGNGTMLFSAENLFGRQNETVERTSDLQLPLIITCIVIFLLDIFVRKFKIKWPKEIKEDRRRNREESVG